MNSKQLPLRNYLTYYDMDHAKKIAANLKRRETNYLKYGTYGSGTLKACAERTKQYYHKLQNKLNSIEVTYTQLQLHDILNSSNYHYTKYLGKAKGRTLIKDNPELYKALFYYTDKYKMYCRHPRFTLSFRLLIAGKYNFTFDSKHYCRCGTYIMFSPTERKITEKSYCKRHGCALGPNSKDHFKYLYGKDWEQKYYTLRYLPEQNPERKRKRQLAGRIAYQKRTSRVDTKFHAIGRHETQLLDEQEKIDNCKIDRNFSIIGYYPDGYCHETNTIYEVYEHYHTYEAQKQRDTNRQKEIQDHLKCDFKIIWDYENK